MKKNYVSQILTKIDNIIETNKFTHNKELSKKLNIFNTNFVLNNEKLKKNFKTLKTKIGQNIDSSVANNLEPHNINYDDIFNQSKLYIQSIKSIIPDEQIDITKLSKNLLPISEEQINIKKELDIFNDMIIKITEEFANKLTTINTNNSNMITQLNKDIGFKSHEQIKLDEYITKLKNINTIITHYNNKCNELFIFTFKSEYFNELLFIDSE